MESNAITLLAGILFLAIAVVGGGFTLERVQVPPVPKWSRIASGALGALFVGIFFYLIVTSETDDAETTGEANVLAAPTQAPSSDAGPESGLPVELYSLSGADPVADGLQLTEFRVSASESEPTVGSSITVDFSLYNASQDPILLADTFVAGRSPDGANQDSDSYNEGVRLAPGQTIPAQDQRIVDQAGRWEFWPCYNLSGSGTCPDEWIPYYVDVGEAE